MYQLPFDIRTDLQPLSLLSVGTMWIIGRKDLPAQNLQELIAWLKAHPNATAGTIGAGSGAHMCLVYFANKAGVQLQYVPYRGRRSGDAGSPRRPDRPVHARRPVRRSRNNRAGSIKAYGVLMDRRWFAAPDIPTIGEAGVPDVQFPFWHGLWAPRERLTTLSPSSCGDRETLADPTVRARLTELGHEVVPRDQQTPAALAAYHKAETEKCGRSSRRRISRRSEWGDGERQRHDARQLLERVDPLQEVIVGSRAAPPTSVTSRRSCLISRRPIRVVRFAASGCLRCWWTRRNVSSTISPLCSIGWA